jgi:hypothetical protein
MRVAKQSLQSLMDACIVFYPGDGGPDPDHWLCVLCGKEWETRQHEPEAHGGGCTLRDIYTDLSITTDPTASPATDIPDEMDPDSSFDFPDDPDPLREHS